MRNLKKALFKTILGLSFIAGSTATALISRPLESKPINVVKASEGYVEYDPREIGQQSFTYRNDGYPSANVEQWPAYRGSDYKCWVRFVVDVETAGDYSIFLKLNVTNTAGTWKCAYLSLSNTDRSNDGGYIVAWDNHTLEDADCRNDPVHFNQGLNVFLVELIWNSTKFEKIYLPEEFTPVTISEQHTYYGMNADNMGVNLETCDHDTLFTPESIIEPGGLYPLGYSKDGLTPNSTMTFTVDEASNSEYFAHINSTSSADKEISYSIDDGVEQTFTIPSYSSNQYSLGVLSSGEHTVKFWRKDDNSIKVNVSKITAVPSAELVSIDSISGTLRGIKNDKWDYSELAVTGTYSDDTTEDITSLCTFTVNSPSLNVSGSGNNASVTVSAAGLSKTFTNVNYVVVGYSSLTPNQIRNQTKILGRHTNNSEYIELDYSLSGLEFNYTGAGDIFADLDVISNTNDTRFVVEVDYGTGTYVSVASSGTDRITLASNLTDGFHHIVFYKTSEAYGNQINLTGLTFAEGAVVAKPVDHKLKLEVIGDSISVGSRLGTGEDAYKSYVMQLAKEWNADISDVSVNGKGLVKSWDIANNWQLGGPQMPEIWSKTLYYRDSNSTYDNSYDADIVVVHLGNNDCQSGTGVTVQQFKEAMSSFNSTLKSAYGEETIIIWTYGSFTNRNWISDLPAYVDSLNSNTIFFTGLPTLNGGLESHPNELEHQTIAQILKGYEDYRFIEAENYGADPSTVKTNQSGQNWSNDGYLGSMNGDKVFFEYSYITVHSGTYLMRIGLTGSNYNIKYSLDNNEVTLSDTHTTSTYYPVNGTFAEYYNVNLNINNGSHTIKLYNATLGGWLNYDYVELFPMVALDTKDQSFVNEFMNETHYECSASLAGRGFNTNVWKNLELRYKSLSSSEKTAILSDNEFILRYTAVLTNHPNLSNFLGANSYIPSNNNFSLLSDDLYGDNGEMLIAIIVFSANILLILCFIIYKKRKEY